MRYVHAISVCRACGHIGDAALTACFTNRHFTIGSSPTQNTSEALGFVCRFAQIGTISHTAYTQSNRIYCCHCTVHTYGHTTCYRSRCGLTNRHRIVFLGFGTCTNSHRFLTRRLRKGTNGQSIVCGSCCATTECNWILTSGFGLTNRLIPCTSLPNSCRILNIRRTNGNGTIARGCGRVAYRQSAFTCGCCHITHGLSEICCGSGLSSDGQRSITCWNSSHTYGHRSYIGCSGKRTYGSGQCSRSFWFSAYSSGSTTSTFPRDTISSTCIVRISAIIKTRSSSCFSSTPNGYIWCVSSICLLITIHTSSTNWYHCSTTCSPCTRSSHGIIRAQQSPW